MTRSGTPPARLAGLLALAVALAAPALAQQRIVIEPGPPGTFNNAIAGDTTAAGDRANPNATYVLRRGAVYIYTAQILSDYPLTIVAEEGDGPRPVIQASFTGSGEAPRPLRALDDLTVRGLYFYGSDNAGVQTDNATIRVAGTDVDLVIDDSHFDGNRLTAVQTDADGTNITITNSIFSHTFNLNTQFGYAVFVREGRNVRDVQIRNSTFYNNNGIAFLNAGSADLVEIRNVTFHNTGNALDFADVVDGGITDRFVFRDNIVYNGGYYGNTPSREFRYVLDADTVFVDDDANEETPDVPQELDFDIANANFYFDPAIAAVYPDSVTQRPLFGNSVQAYFDETEGREATVFSEQLDFVDPPSTAALIARLRYTYDNQSEQGAPFLDRDPRDPANSPATPGLTADEQLPVDFAYSTSARSYTAGTNGCPLGDLNWFDNPTAAACLMAVAGEDGPGGTAALGLRVAPNPATASTALLIDLGAASAVTVSVFDMLGREVLRQEATLAAGAAHRVMLDVSAVPSGAYVVRVRAEGGAGVLQATQRVTVVR